MAPRAKLKSRHYGVMLSFALMVVAPMIIAIFYMLFLATDQYASRVAFSVRQEDQTSPAEFMGGIASFIGSSSGGADTDILYEYIQSQDMVARIDERLGLREHFTAPHRMDPVFSLSPEGTIEDLVDFWSRVLRISYDQNTGLVDLQVTAFSPEMAQKIAGEIISESQDLVNQINAVSRADVLRYAEGDVATALERLKKSREAMVKFRTTTQIVDPETDLKGRLGVLAGLQQQLAEALVEFDLLAETAASDDPRMTQNARWIQAIRGRITEERRSFAEDESLGESYPKLLAEYESLLVDREFAEETYQAALASLDVARSTASRQSRYIATYIRPTLAEQSEYPQRGIIIGLTLLFVFLTWGVSTMIFYALRDRK